MTRKLSFLLLTLFILICLTQNIFSQTLSTNSDSNNDILYQKGVITVKLKERLSSNLTKGATSFSISSVDEKLSQYGVTKISKRFTHKPIPKSSDLPDLSRIYKIRILENQDIEKVIEELSNDPNVEYAERVAIYKLNSVPNDSLYSMQSHLKQIHAEEAWDIHKSENGSKPIIIGICDSGVKWDHPDLIDNIWQNLGEDADNDGHVIEWADSVWILDPGDRNGIDDDGNGYTDDFVGWNAMGVYGEDPSNPTDADGHGTHVAGIAAAVTNNGIGVSGISWNAKIMTSCQSSNLSPYPGYIIDGFSGIIYLAEAGADIINCSWGGSSYGGSKADEEAIKYASMLGSIVVCAAGNFGSLGIIFPAKYPNVVAVGGTTSEDEKHRNSNYGAAVDVMAPYSILSTDFYDDYSVKNGTSMSSPLVAGLLALIKSYFPEMNNDQLVERLIYTSDNIDHLNPGYENYLGSGRINAYRALTDTILNIPKLFRLDISEFTVASSWEAEGVYNISFKVLNSTNYSYKEKVTFYLSTDDPDVEILNSSVSRNLLADDYNTISRSFSTKTFSFRIKDNVKFHRAKFKITANSEIPVVMRDFTFDFEILPASGVFIYDRDSNDTACSGELFKKYLSEEKQNINYSSNGNFPSSLKNFDAVLLSFGNTKSDFYFPNKVIEEYLEQGGKLYVESGNLFSDRIENKNLMALMGLENVTLIEEPELELDSLFGDQESITNGMSFNKTEWENISSIEVYEPNKISKVAFTDKNYGVVAIENDGLNGQKTFLSSYSLYNLYDVDSVSSRSNLVSKIFSFLDLPISFSANFDAKIIKGRYPLKVKFYDLSLPDSGRQLISRKWDFDNDGNIDSEEFCSEWTYNEPGVYTVTFEVSDGKNTKLVTRENYIKVLNNDTALEFNGNYNGDFTSIVSLSTDSSLSINSNFTLEVWIKPYEAELSSYYSHLFAKSTFSLIYDHKQKSIKLINYYKAEQFTESQNTTPSNSIKPGQWQHVAAVYNAKEKDIKIYINGIEQPLELEGEILDSLKDNSWADLSIGNNGYLGTPFNGAIDEVRMWDVPRSENEILDNMKNSLRGDEEGLVLYLPLNKGSGNKVSDYSVFNRTGSTTGTKWIDGLNGIITSIESDKENNYVPESYTLYQNYPNPFNPTTTIKYNIPSAGKVSLKVYNILGKEVRTLVDKEMEKGYHSVNFNAANLASGIYFYRLKTGTFTDVKKLVLIK